MSQKAYLLEIKNHGVSRLFQLKLSGSQQVRYRRLRFSRLHQKVWYWHLHCTCRSETL